jgi:PKD repeat protein
MKMIFFIAFVCVCAMTSIASAQFFINNNSHGEILAAGQKSIFEYNTTTQTTDAAISTSVHIRNIAVSPDEKFAYGTDNIQSVYIFNISNCSVDGSINLGFNPNYNIMYNVISQDGTKLFVSGTNYSGQSKLFVVNLADNTVIRTIDLDMPINVMVIGDNGTKLYLSPVNPINHTIEVYDTSTYEFIRNIPSCSSMISVSPDGSRIFMPCALNGSLGIFDTSSDTVIKMLTLPNKWIFATISTQDNSKLYLATGVNESPQFHGIDVIDVADNYTNTKHYEVGENNNNISLWDYLLTPDGTELYTMDSNSPNGYYINLTTDTIVSKQLNDTLTAIAMISTSDISFKPFDIYGGNGNGNVNNTSSQTSFIKTRSQGAIIALGQTKLIGISTFNDNIGTEISVGIHARSIALSPDGNMSYATDDIDNLYGIKTTNYRTFAIDHIMPLEVIPKYNIMYVTIATDGSHLYVSDTNYSGISKILVINPFDYSIMRTINTDISIASMAIADNGTKLYIAADNYAHGIVEVYDLSTDTVINRIPISTFSITASRDGTKIYVPSNLYGYLNILDASTGNVIQTVSPPGTWVFKAVSSLDGTRLCMTTGGNSSVFYNGIAVFNVTNGYSLIRQMNIGDPSYTSLGDLIITEDNRNIYTIDTSSPVIYDVNISDGALNALSLDDILTNIALKAASTTPLFPVFTANVTSGAAPLTVKFTDASSSLAVRWLWNFQDGNGSTEENPVHTFTQNGTYYVSLNISNCTDPTEDNVGYVVKTMMIQVGTSLPQNNTTANTLNIKSTRAGQLSGGIQSTVPGLNITSSTLHLLNQGPLSGVIATVVDGVNNGFSIIVLGIGILGFVIVLRALDYL